jgi:hypothetical protein
MSRCTTITVKGSGDQVQVQYPYEALPAVDPSQQLPGGFQADSALSSGDGHPHTSSGEDHDGMELPAQSRIDETASVHTANQEDEDIADAVIDQHLTDSEANSSVSRHRSIDDCDVQRVSNEIQLCNPTDHAAYTGNSG